MEKLTKTQELITPAIKITPPPPPPRTHLSKDPRLKHLFTISCFALLGIAAVLAIASCGGTSGTPLTSLTYSASTIGAAEGNAITDITPAIVPKDATVEYTVSPSLPAGLELSPKSGVISGTPTDAYAAEAVYTVTATGTDGYAGKVSADITIAVGTLSTNIEVSTVRKANPAEDKRYHYVAFTIQADGTTSMGRHKFALSLETDPPPTVQEMNDGDGVYRIVNPAEKKVLLSYTLGSEISKLMTNADYFGKMVQHGESIGGTAADVDGYLLSPGTEYSLYALKDGGSSVEKLHDFTTDTFDTASTFTGEGKHLDTAVFGGEYMIDLDDPVFVFPISFIPLSDGGFYTYTLKKETSNQAFFVFSFNDGKFVAGSPLVTSDSVVLVPSQSITGGKPQVPMGGNKDIAMWYLPFPMNLVETGVIFSLFRETAELITITPTLDQ